jgi:hypothetical protein
VVDVAETKVLSGGSGGIRNPADPLLFTVLTPEGFCWLSPGFNLGARRSKRQLFNRIPYQNVEALSRTTVPELPTAKAEHLARWTVLQVTHVEM